MQKATAKILISKLFFLIFAIKMVLSVAPLVVSIDKDTMHSVILQLELENETQETSKDTSAFKKALDSNYIDDFTIDFAISDCNLKYYVKPRHYINSFYPSVLTPPPNMV